MTVTTLKVPIPGESAVSHSEIFIIYLLILNSLVRLEVRKSKLDRYGIHYVEIIFKTGFDEIISAVLCFVAQNRLLHTMTRSSQILIRVNANWLRRIMHYITRVTIF